MTRIALAELVREHVGRAVAAANGRSAETVFGGQGRVMRQTLLALRGGESLAEHDSPGEATIQVLHGRVRLRAGEESWEGAVGDLLVIPWARHALDALEDSAVLLTVARSA